MFFHMVFSPVGDSSVSVVPSHKPQEDLVSLAPAGYQFTDTSHKHYEDLVFLVMQEDVLPSLSLVYGVVLVWSRLSHYTRVRHPGKRLCY